MPSGALLFLAVVGSSSGMPVTAHVAGSARVAQVPGLNHAYVVLDQETFDAIRNSRALAAMLGPSDTGLPSYAPPEADADRLFLRGRETYLELFAPTNRFAEPVGKVGIGIAADRRDRFRMLERSWQATCGGELTRSTVEWTRSQPAVPWYDVLYCEATGSGDDLVLWAMIYRPEFHGWLYGVPSAPPRIARRDLLASRVSAGQGRFEVTGLTIDVAPPLFASLVTQLQGAGFQRRDTPSGTRLTGDDWALTLRPVSSRPGLRSIDLATTADVMRDLRLGSATLVHTNAGNARLRFR